MQTLVFFTGGYWRGLRSHLLRRDIVRGKLLRIRPVFWSHVDQRSYCFASSRGLSHARSRVDGRCLKKMGGQLTHGVRNNSSLHAVGIQALECG